MEQLTLCNTTVEVFTAMKYFEQCAFKEYMKNGHYLDLSWVHLLADLNFMKIGSLYLGSHFKENTFPPKAYLNLLNSSSHVCFQDRKSNEDKACYIFMLIEPLSVQTIKVDILLILLLLLILLFSLSYKLASFTAVLWDVTQGNLRERCATFQRTAAKESN